MPAPSSVQLLQRLRWIAPGAILALAALLRLWALGRPDSLVFDELYYVRDAVTQLGRVSYIRSQVRIAAITTPARYVTASLS